MASSSRLEDQDAPRLLFCLGCGENVKSHADNRRALQGSVEGERVVEAWRANLDTLQCEVEEEQLCVDSLLSKDVSKDKMCRRCFSAFDRYSKLRSSLLENLAKAVKSQVNLQAQEPAKKRPRLDKFLQYTSQSSISTVDSSGSPSVSVSI